MKKCTNRLVKVSKSALVVMKDVKKISDLDILHDSPVIGDAAATIFMFDSDTTRL